MDWKNGVARTLGVVTGLWLMVAPSVFDYVETTAEANDRIVGPVATSLAFIAVTEIGRALRWGTLPLGAWLLVAPFLLGYGMLDATVVDVTAGIVLIAVAPVRGTVEQRFAGSWSSLWRDPSPGTTEG